MSNRGWATIKLSSILVNETSGFWGDPPNGTNEIKVIRSTNFRSSGRLDLTDVAVRSFPDSKLSTKCLEYGDILLERSGGGPKQPVGRVVFFDRPGEYSFSNFIQRLRVDKSRCSDKFALYELWHFHATGGTELLQQATTGIRNLQYRDYLDREIALPPLPEQRKIAAILSSVDDTIEKTRAAVDELRAVKRALMQQLLTRGIPGLHTQFVPIVEEWRLGRVTEDTREMPAVWSLVQLTSVARLESGHTPSRRHPEYWDGDIPWISLHDTQNLDVPEIFETAQTIGPLGLANSSARLLPKGTVVFSRTATVGKACVMGMEMATSQDFANYVCGERVYNRYLMHLFRFMRREWERLMAGSTHKTIYMPVFRDLQVLLPPVEEQKEIAHIADALERRIDMEVESVDALRALKSALLSLLLTGEVRVTPDPEPTP